MGRVLIGRFECSSLLGWGVRWLLRGESIWWYGRFLLRCYCLSSPGQGGMGFCYLLNVYFNVVTDLFAIQLARREGKASYSRVDSDGSAVTGGIGLFVAFHLGLQCTWCSSHHVVGSFLTCDGRSLKGVNPWKWRRHGFLSSLAINLGCSILFCPNFCSSSEVRKCVRLTTHPFVFLWKWSDYKKW